MRVTMSTSGTWTTGALPLLLPGAGTRAALGAAAAARLLAGDLPGCLVGGTPGGGGDRDAGAVTLQLRWLFRVGLAGCRHRASRARARRLGAAALRGTAAGQAAVDLDGQVLELRVPLLQVGEHRGGNEDRGVGAGQHADEQHERQVLQGAGAKQAGADEQDARDGDPRGERRVD